MEKITNKEAQNKIDQLKNTKIWRYLSFDKFIDLIITGELHFSPASSFEDTWEMHPPACLRNRDNWRKAILSKNSSLNGCDVDIELLIDDAIGLFLNSYNNKDLEYYFSCWSKTDQDHAALWNIFTDKKNAVAISTTPLKIFQALKFGNEEKELQKISQHFQMIETHYIDFEEENLNLLEFPNKRIQIYFSEESDYIPGSIRESKSMPLPYSFKRSSFCYEEEVRLVFFSSQNSEPFARIKFDPNYLIEDIVIAPLANESFVNHIKAICAGREFGYNIRRSKLTPPQLTPEEIELSNNYVTCLKNYRKVQAERRNKQCGYIVFDSKEGFEKWHQEVKRFMGLPRFGRRGDSGDYGYAACGTYEWCEPEPYKDGKYLGYATPSICFEHKLEPLKIAENK